MSIATPALTNFTAGEVSPRLKGRIDISKYYNACSEAENFIIHPHGGATRRSGLRYVADAVNHATRSLLVPFEFNAEQSYVLEFGETGGGQGAIRVFKDRGQVLDEDGQAVSVDSPYSLEDLATLKYVQSNDTLILVHPKHPPRSLTRLDHDDWTLAAIEFTDPPEQWGEGNWPSVACFFEDRLALAATPDRPNTVWLSRTGEYFDFRMNTREVPLADWGEVLVKTSSGTIGTGTNGETFLLLDGESFEAECAVKGVNPDGEKRYFRYKGGKVLLASLEDLTITFGSTSSSTGIEAVYSGSVLNSTAWDEYAIGDRIPTTDGTAPLDDDAIEITLSASQANAIEFMVAKSRLWIGTIGGEWTLGGASTSDPITPASAKANQEGASGSARARPVSVGFGSLFIQRAGRKLREMSYRFDSDSHASQDLTILAEHITAPSITQLAYAQEPDSIVYAVRSDGVLLALTYQKDQDVLAWSRLTTKGVVESICSIFDHDNSTDQLWLMVRREINGQEHRFVEILEPTFEKGATADAFFLDCGLSYEGEPVNTLAGLDHLAGEAVTVLADGLALSSVAVSETGELSLPQAASRVHAGLPYTSVLSPMAMESGSARGTAQTKTKRITEVSVRFHNTLGGEIGPDRDNLEPVMFLTSSAPLGQALELFCGDKRVKFPKGWGEEGSLVISQSQPWPMSVLMIVPEVVVNT